MLRCKAVRCLCLVGAVVLAVAMVGCAKQSKTTGMKIPGARVKPLAQPTGEPYKIGAIFSITGSEAPLGQPEKETTEMLEKKINQEGGIDGHPLQITIYDTAGKEDTSVMAVNRLIQMDNVLAIIGPSSTGTTLAVIPIAEKQQVPLVSCAAAVSITEPVKKWVFKTPQTDAMAVERIFAVLKHRGIQKIAAISASTAFGDAGLAQMQKQAPAAGIQIVAQEKFGQTDTDMTTQLTRIKGTPAQAVVCWGTNPGPATVTKNMKQLGMTIPLFQSHGVANQTYIKLAGEAAEGVMFPAGKLLVAQSLPDSDPQKKVLLDYKAEFEKAYGKPPDTFGGHAYDAVMMVTDALRKSGPERAKLRDEIEKTKDFVGIGGVFNMSPTDHNGLTSAAFVMVKIQNGQWVLAEEQ